MAKITVQNTEITVVSVNAADYISLTDMANAKEGESRAADIIKNWLRNRYTLEFLGTWEMIHNPGFKVVEFDHFKSQAGLPSFVLSVSEWIDKTDAPGSHPATGFTDLRQRGRCAERSHVWRYCPRMARRTPRP